MNFVHYVRGQAGLANKRENIRLDLIKITVSVEQR